MRLRANRATSKVQQSLSEGNYRRIVSSIGVKKKRLTTLDFLRGYFLFIIIVDHVELYPSGLDFLTGRGRLWVSAAEGFFFISGLLVAYIYRKKLLKGFSFGWIWKKMWRRAAQLYMCSIALTLLFTYWAIASGDKGIKYGLPAVIHWPQIIWDTALLRYSFGWADFLPHYVIFMVAAPFVFYLLAKGKWWVVVPASIFIWLHRGQEGFDLAWQTLFFGGMLAGFYWDTLLAKIRSWSAPRKVLLRRTVYTLAGVTFICSYLSVFLLSELNAQAGALPSWLVGITMHWDAINTSAWHYLEKWTMEPGRMATFAIWFAAVYIWCEAHAATIQRMTRGAFEVLGRNSLFVYGLHALVIFVLHLALRGHTTFWQNFLITTGTLAVIWAITYAKENLATLKLPMPVAPPHTATLSRLVIEKGETE